MYILMNKDVPFIYFDVVNLLGETTQVHKSVNIHNFP